MLNFKNVNILVVGDVMLDYYVYLQTKRLSSEAPVIIYSHTDSIYELGGAANVAKNIKSLGGRVTLLGVVGPDTPGQIIKSLARQSGIKYFLFVESGRRTTIKTRLMVNDRQILRYDKESTFNIKQLIDFDAGKPDIIVVSDYAKGMISKLLMDKLATLKTKIIVNGKPNNIGLYKNIDTLIFNKEETDMSLKLLKLNSRGDLLKKLHINNLIVTEGKDGLSLYKKDGKIHYDILPVKVKDVTGAGDSVVAGFAVAYVKFDINKAARLANIVSVIKVGKPRTSAVTIKELLRRIKK